MDFVPNEIKEVAISIDSNLKMADSIRRRRLEQRDYGGRGLDDSLITSEDLMATEPDFDAAVIGAHLPHIYRLGSLKESNDNDDGNDDEHKLLLQHEKVSVDHSLSWFKRTKKSLHGDFTSICLLLFLYLLQGIPLGLIAAIPLVLSSRNVSFAQQAVFSFAYWPFSVKLLWAPVVDSVYWKALGRRKSWMIPCQYLIGLFMLFISYKVDSMMGLSDLEPKAPNVVLLLLCFLPLNFLAATQDIAVDGWALTMLSRKNVGYASTCNAVGQTTGFFLGNVVYLTLDSPDFANRFFRSKPQPYGLITLSEFFFFWGIVFIITTTLVLIFKKEVDHSACQRSGSTSSDDDELELGVFDTYILLWDIVRLKPMLWMIVILLTGKVAFGATDGMTGLKLIAMGMPKDKLSSMAVFLTPVQVLLPWFIGKWTAGSGPLNVFLLAYPYRIFMGGIFAALVWWTPSFRTERDFSFILYVLWIVAYCFHQVASYSMFVSMMAFNAQVSDPKIGGTYMTLLNTLNNLGGNWPVTLVLSLADYLSYYICFTKGSKSSLYSCNAKVLSDQCKSSGNVCEVVIDGYYVAVALCSVIGIIWFKAFFNKIKCLQKIPRTDWRVFSK